jgi:uncharacterized protein
MTSDEPKKPRGFAAMPPEILREIARTGGRAAHAAGTAYEFTPETARAAGMIGGRARKKKARRRASTGDSSSE